MADQQFCLKWNNHQGNMVTVFDDLFSSQSFVDVTLACEGSSIKAHKVVLSACSPFFEELFKNNPCKHPIVIMKDMKYYDLKTIIQFMYKGEVNVSQDRLSALLKTAENLQVKGLAEVNADNQVSETSSAAPTQYQEEVKKTPTTQSRRRARASPTKDNRMNTASPEIIEEISAKQPRQEINTPSHSKNQTKEINSNRSHSFSQYTDQFETSEPDYHDPTKSQTEKSQLEVTPEFSFLPVPGDINSEESTGSFAMTADMERDTKPPSSPLVLPIPIEKEVSRIKSSPSYDDYQGYEGDNSQQQAYDEGSYDPSQMLDNTNDSLQMDDMGAGPSQMDSPLTPGTSNTGCIDADSLKPRFRTMRSKNGFQCSVCGETFKWRAQVYRHQVLTHNIKPSMFKCKYCPTFLTSRTKILSHIQSCHPQEAITIEDLIRDE